MNPADWPVVPCRGFLHRAPSHDFLQIHNSGKIPEKLMLVNYS